MSEEIFDVVNDEDAVIGQKPRHIVHRDCLKHRAIHVLVYRANGDLFLQKRSMSKDTFPGVWDSSCSGHLDRGEDYDACAVRELGEELGLTISQPPARLFKIAACEDTGQEFVWVYQLDSEGPFVLHPQEIERGDWFPPGHISEWVQTRPHDFAPAFLKIWAMSAGGH